MSEQNLNKPQVKIGELQSNEKELRSILTEGAAQLEVAVNDQMTDAFMDYMRLLLEWNEKVNLTSITDEKGIIIKHFLDSISIIPHIPFISGRASTSGASEAATAQDALPASKTPETGTLTSGASEPGAALSGTSEPGAATSDASKVYASETGTPKYGASKPDTAQDALPAGNSASLADIGTGAGFPGIAVKIAKGCGNLLLLDSLEKRIKFLENTISSLSLESTEAVHSRAEDAGRSPVFREAYDCTVARAVASLNVLLEYCLPFVKPGGVFIAMKGPEPTQECDEAKKALNILGGEILKVVEFTLPFSEMQRSLIIVKKIRQTSTMYPRKAGKPSKFPLI